MMRAFCLFPCALLAAACSGQDIDIGHGSVSSSSTNGDAGGTMMPTGSGPNIRDHASAIVIRSIDLPFTGTTTSGPGTSGSSSGVTAGSTSSATGAAGSGSTIDPELRYLFIGNGPPTCGDPSAGSLCDFFRVTIRIPSYLFVPGVRLLQDARIQSTYSSRGPDHGGGECSGGGGDFIDGTLEIVDVASNVTVRLADTAKLGFDADGSYVAVQCQ